MKERKSRVLVTLIILILILCGAAWAQAGQWELKKLWSREFPNKPVSLRLAPEGQRCAVVTSTGGGEDIIDKLYVLDNEGEEIWSKSIQGKLNCEFAGNKDLMVGFCCGKDTGSGRSFHNEEGKVMWKKLSDVDIFRISPEGKYIGYSGILNIFDPSSMDWWELRDREFNLLWKYPPEHNIDAVVLGDGKTLMVEGREVKTYDSGGRELKKVVIPKIKPFPIAYQAGFVNATNDSGPLYLAGTRDARYAAFIYTQYDHEAEEWWETLYSVDMEKGTWWSRSVGDSGSTRGVELSNDGRYLLLQESKKALLFDNHTGELLWEDRSGRTRAEWPYRILIRSDFFSVNDSTFVVLNWATYQEDDDRSKRKWMYFVDLKGKRVKLFDELIYHLYDCQKSGRYILQMKGDKVNKYKIVKKGY